MRMMSPGSIVGASGQKEDDPDGTKRDIIKTKKWKRISSRPLRDNPETRASGKRDECIRQDGDTPLTKTSLASADMT